MSENKSPAFQFYPQDFMSDAKVKLMSLEERGAYMMLLCHDWTECGIPVDDDDLAKLSEAYEKWPEMKKRVLKCFKKSRSRYYNPRLKRERNKQKTHRKQKQEAGKASAKARKQKKLEEETDANGCSTDVDVSLQQKSTLHTSSSTSVIRERETNAREENQTVALIEPPPKLIALFERVCGTSTALVTWLNDCGYQPEWIRHALERTEEARKDRPISYCRTILQGIKRDGGMKENDGKSGFNRGSKATGAAAQESRATSGSGNRSHRGQVQSDGKAKPGKFDNHPAG